MPKKITERERLLGYSYRATKEELDEAVEIFRTALRARFASTKRKGGTRGKKTNTSTVGETSGGGTERSAVASG